MILEPGETYLIEATAGVGVSDVVVAITGITYSDWFQPADYENLFFINFQSENDPGIIGHWIYARSTHSASGQPYVDLETLEAKVYGEYSSRSAYAFNGERSINMQSNTHFTGNSQPSGFFSPSHWQSDYYAQGTTMGVRISDHYAGFSGVPSDEWDLTAVGADYQSENSTWLGLDIEIVPTVAELSAAGGVPSETHAVFTYNFSPTDTVGTGRTVVTIDSDDVRSLLEPDDFGNMVGDLDPVVVSVQPDDYGGDPDGYVWVVAQEPVITGEPTFAVESDAFGAPYVPGHSFSIAAEYATALQGPGFFMPLRHDKWRPPLTRYVIPFEPIYALLNPDLSADIDRIQANFDRL
jgi:hypothetical protein